ncbi:hypothetical protein [uncultured Pseudacidovorax sp.]|uniref:hypothetical protein n=1 Tax=uncultured Pseudacidovorax sp. TaxID=679313 RepID=UPI0025FF6EBB|nr:hypothetical protein [uncultured Pseudacidovorax sp.]
MPLFDKWRWPRGIDAAPDNIHLITEEARLSKHLFKLAAQATCYGEFTRAKRGESTDAAKRFLDHDDWAVVEPSSMRSLIQLAGRVRRHRAGPVAGANMTVLGSNLRRYKRPDQPAYCKPGFETLHEPFRLKTHDLRTLLGRPATSADSWHVDAQPRVALPPSGKLFPGRRLVDLEHARMHDMLLPMTLRRPSTAEA